jgi:copper chaperone NosL
MNKMSLVTRMLVFIAAFVVLGSLYYPIWKIELDAPQYPEGLELNIWADTMAGDVDIVNGLNHYIGMDTIHSEEFIEFTVLPYILWALAGLGVIVALLNRKKWLYGYLGLFVVFAIVSLVDFYMWEYKYGHNLDPNAPIQVPGMAYQPPLIGFKQLLNFGAYSIPDTGGWALLASGILLCLSAAIEIVKAKRIKMKILPQASQMRNAAIFIIALLLTGCNEGPVPITPGKDICDHCKMVIMDNKYSCEIVTVKGKVFKFDDMTCMSAFTKTDPVKNAGGHNTYVQDYNVGGFVAADSAYFISSSSLKGPMGGNTCAFKDEAAQKKAITDLNGTAVQFADIIR